nr:ribosome small subunit-dependent GTPase A [Sulfoacidibacillus ferrooxidans]
MGTVDRGVNVTGRIVKAISGFYYVRLEDGRVLQCKARGVFKKRDINPLVGDLVDIDAQGTQEGTITEVHPRHSALVRPPVANVDQALLVVSLVQPPLSLYQLDKMLAMLALSNIEVGIGFTKVDLPFAQQVLDEVKPVYTQLNYEVLELNVRSGVGLQSLERFLKGKITVLTGQSGVGKSTMLKTLVPESGALTGHVGHRSKRGRQTTTHVELYPYTDGYVADTPGFSQYDFDKLEPTHLGSLFREIAQYSADCEYRGCLHITDSGCAVLAAVESNQIVKSRYHSYVQLVKELQEAKARRY